MKKDEKNIEKIRHSFAHLLAQAVSELWPKAKLGIGPTIEDGFYYDFDNVEIGENDLASIQKRMKKIAARGLTIKKELWTTGKARAYFKRHKAKYKLELIDDLKKETPSKGKVGIVYTGKDFLDLCRGGHVKNTRELPLDAFKLTRVAGAYWKGDEKRPMLTRVYGVAFATKKELEKYREQMAEAERRDHKKLGRELGLFVFSDLVGPGLPLFTPKGTTIFNELIHFSDTLKREAGFTEVHIPHLAKLDLYKVSGHLEKFKNDVFYVKGKEDEFIIKPMNCPHHIQIYTSSPHSYRDLPVRFFETTTTYRDEQTGELGGLTRVRSITMDDSHVFARENQIEHEFNNIIKQILKVVKAFHVKDYTIRLSLRDEKNKKAYLGDDKIWKQAQTTMERILKKNKVKYVTARGEAAFYGPKMDFMINDSLGRQWQISTIQLDLNLPERFKLEYTDKDGKAKRPIIIHSAFLGSIERFMGILIEHYGGAFPVWLAPEQVWIVPVSDKFNAYGRSVLKELLNADVRARMIDEGSLGKKIREGQIQKIPYLLIVGDKEKRAGTIAVRDRKKGDIGAMKIGKFIEKISEEIEKKK